VLLDVHRKQGGTAAIFRLLTAAAIIGQFCLLKSKRLASVVCIVALA
jgi:hypothetical protein